LKTVVVAGNNSGNLLQTIAELEPKQRLDPLLLGSAGKCQARAGVVDVGKQELLVAVLQGPSNEFFGFENTVAQTETRVYTHVIEI